jgi:hypothetical protein
MRVEALLPDNPGKSRGSGCGGGVSILHRYSTADFWAFELSATINLEMRQGIITYPILRACQGAQYHLSWNQGQAA